MLLRCVAQLPRLMELATSVEKESLVVSINKSLMATRREFDRIELLAVDPNSGDVLAREQIARGPAKVTLHWPDEAEFLLKLLGDGHVIDAVRVVKP